MRRGLAEEARPIETVQDHPNGFAGIELYVKERSLGLAGMHIRPSIRFARAKLLVSAQEDVGENGSRISEVPPLVECALTNSAWGRASFEGGVDATQHTSFVNLG